MANNDTKELEERISELRRTFNNYANSNSVPKAMLEDLGKDLGKLEESYQKFSTNVNNYNTSFGNAKGFDIQGLLNDVMGTVSLEDAVTRSDGFELERKKLAYAKDKIKVLENAELTSLVSDISSLFDIAYDGKAKHLVTEFEKIANQGLKGAKAEFESSREYWVSSMQLLYKKAAQKELISAAKERLGGKPLDGKFEEKLLSNIEPYFEFGKKILKGLWQTICYAGKEMPLFNLFEPNDGAWKIFDDVINSYLNPENKNDFVKHGNVVGHGNNCPDIQYAFKAITIYYIDAHIKMRNEFVSEKKFDDERTYAVISFAHKMEEKLAELKKYRTAKQAQSQNN